MVLYITIHPDRRGHPNSHHSLEDALVGLKETAAVFAARVIKDAAVRERYLRSIDEMSRDILWQVDSGRLTAEQGATLAIEMRNAIMELSRSKTSRIGLMIAEEKKRVGPTYEDLILYRTKELYPETLLNTKEQYPISLLKRLTPGQRNGVMRAIIEGASHDDARVTSVLRGLRPLARGVIGLSIGLTIYDIYNTPDHELEAKHQGVLWGAGVGGALLTEEAATALGASLVCGPAAPYCFGVLVVIGGVAFTIGADYWWHRLSL